MSSTDQHLVDYLFEQIFVQRLRCTHFNSISPQTSTNSIWNRHSDEIKILDLMVQQYKKYYINKAEQIKTKLADIKENNISSYLTYDTEYYINQYNDRVEQVKKYLVELDAKTNDHISTDKLSHISSEIDELFPNFISDPTLLGRIEKLYEKN